MFMDVIYFITGVGLLSQYGEVSRFKLQDFSLLVPCIILFVVSHRLLFPLVKRFGRNRLAKNMKVSVDQLTRSDDERVHAFVTKVFSGTFHFITSVFCYLAFRLERWWFLSTYTLMWEYESEVQYTFSLKLYYMIELSYVVFKSMQLLYDRIIKGVKKEFLEMLIHHVVTLGLILFSYISSNVYFGILVFFVHNISDVITYACRCCNDLKSQVSAALLLPPTVLAWLFFRMFLYPYYIIGAGFRTICHQNISNYRNQALMYFLVVLMMALYCLHIYWSYGIMYVTYKVWKTIICKEDFYKPRNEQDQNYPKGNNYEMDIEQGERLVGQENRVHNEIEVQKDEENGENGETILEETLKSHNQPIEAEV